MVKTSKCIIENCNGIGTFDKKNNKRYFIKGLCEKHYGYLKRYGDPLRETRIDKKNRLIEEIRQASIDTPSLNSLSDKFGIGDTTLKRWGIIVDPNARKTYRNELISRNRQQYGWVTYDWIVGIKNKLKRDIMFEDLIPYFDNKTVEQIRWIISRKPTEVRSLVSHKPVGLEHILKPYFDWCEVHRNRYDIIKPKELDIFLPEYNIAIEVNDTRTHNSTRKISDSCPPKSPMYHQKKSLMCAEIGINLIHLYQWDILDNKLLEKNIAHIKNMCGVGCKSMSSGSLKRKKISHKEASRFYEANHLQGAGETTPVNYALYRGDDIYQVMSFAYRGGVWRLSRFATKSGYIIKYGSKRLFNGFINEHDPEKIISFSDMDKTSGKVYERLGFKTEGISKPSYWWVKNGHQQVLWRRRCQKQFLCKILSDYDPDLSERENMERNGYVKVYSSGMRKHIWSK